MDRLEFRSIPTVNGHQIGKFDPKYDFLLLEEPKGFEGDDQPRWQVGDIEYTTKWKGQQLRVSETAFRKSRAKGGGYPLWTPSAAGRVERARRDITPTAAPTLPLNQTGSAYDVPLPPEHEHSDPPLNTYGLRDLSIVYKEEYDAFRQKLRDEDVEPHALNPLASSYGRCPEIIREWLSFLASKGVTYTDYSMTVDFTNDRQDGEFKYPTLVKCEGAHFTKPSVPNWGIFDDNHSLVPDLYPFIACRQVYSPIDQSHTWYIIGHYYYYTDPVFADNQFEFPRCSLIEYINNMDRYVGGTRASCIQVCKDFGIDTNKTEGPGLLMPTRYAYVSRYNWMSPDSMWMFQSLQDAMDMGMKKVVPTLDLMDYGDFKSTTNVKRIRWYDTGLDYRLNIYARRCVVNLYDYDKEEYLVAPTVSFYHVIPQLRSATSWSYRDWDTSITRDRLACNPITKLPTFKAGGAKLLTTDIQDAAERDLIGRVDMKLVLQSGAVLGASALIGILLYYKTKDATLSALVAGGVLIVGGATVVILNIEQLASILNRVMYENPLVAVAGTSIAAAGAFGAGTALIKKFI